MADDVSEMGPVDYLVVEFPGNRMTGEAFPLLVDRTREQVSSEKLADRVRRMRAPLERAAAAPPRRRR